MRIALTGATGRVGSRLVPRLLDAGHEVRALVRSGTPHGVTVINGDLSEPAKLKKLVDGADVVLHLAAALRTDLDHEKTNVDGTRALAEATGDRNFVHVSTNLVYPAGLGRPSTEDDPADPDPQWGEYARTKAVAEQQLSEHATIVRLAFVYGDVDPHLRESLRWAGTWPTHHRLHMIHHADVAQALSRAMTTRGRIYNAADDCPITAAELHQLNEVEIPQNQTQNQTQAPDPWHGVVSTNRIQRELGFRPRFPSAWVAKHAGAL